MSATWVAVLAGSMACYGLKLAGWTVPASVLDRPAVRRGAALLPLALLAALVVVQTLGRGGGLAVDARSAGLAVAGVLVLLRAPFLLVVVAAAATAALLRL